MYRIEQVLVPVDFSSFSRSALAFARSLDTGRGGELSPRLQMAHAIESLPEYVRSVLFPYAPLGEDDREFEAEIREAAKKKLHDYFELDDELFGRFIDDPIVEFGSSKENVRRWESRLDVDLVAVGAYGRHGVYAAGPGSTSRRLVASSAVPVALIRDYEPKPQIRRILVAVDLGRSTDDVMETAVAMAVGCDAKLQLLHVIPSPFMYDTDWEVERHVELTAGELEEVLRPRVERKMAELFDKRKASFADQQAVQRRLEGHTVRVGDPAAEIGREASDGDIDLVVLGAGSRKSAQGVGRVASAVMAEVPKHQVVVPGKRENTPLDRRNRK